MINVVGRAPLTDVTAVKLVSFEHVLCDVRGEPLEWVPTEFGCNVGGGRVGCRGDVEVALPTLGELRVDPGCSGSNLRLDGVDVAAREASALAGAGASWRASGDAGLAVVCDLTNVDEGRSVDGLARAAAKVKEGVFFAFGASLGRSEIADALARDYGERELVASLRRQLVVGVDVEPDARRTFGPGAPQTPKAAFVGPLRPTFGIAGRDDGSAELSEVDLGYLRAAVAAAEATGAPIVVCLPPGDGEEVARRVDEV